MRWEGQAVAGEDVQPGDVAVRSGAFIGSAQVGLLAAVGRDKVLVHPKPRLSIISVGDELVDVSRSPGPGQVYDVNSFALAAAARDAGAEVNRVGIAPRDPRKLHELVEARLLVSEIKLYHEADVLDGRRDRDLTTRLGGEIARARAMYEQRVPAQVRHRADFFRDELVRTLAGGDGSLIGS